MFLLYILIFIAVLCGFGYWFADHEKNPATGILLCVAAGFLLAFIRDAALDAANLLEDIFQEWKRGKHEAKK